MSDAEISAYLLIAGGLVWVLMGTVGLVRRRRGTEGNDLEKTLEDRGRGEEVDASEKCLGELIDLLNSDHPLMRPHVDSIVDPYLVQVGNDKAQKRRELAEAFLTAQSRRSAAPGYTPGLIREAGLSLEKDRYRAHSEDLLISVITRFYKSTAWPTMGKDMRLLAIGLGLAFGWATQAMAEESRSDLFSQQPGRYQIVINPQARADTFLLDTATGRVWQLIQYKDLKDAPPVWLLMKRIDNDGDLKKLQREYGKDHPQIDDSDFPPARTPPAH